MTYDYDRRAVSVPGVVQPPNWCGPAALKAVLAAYGKDVEMAVIASLAGTTDSGTSGEGLVSAAQALGFPASIEDESDLPRLRELLDEDLAPIVNWWQETDGHYSVVTDLNNSEIEIMDPVDGNLKWMSREEFDTNWFDFPDRSRSVIYNRRIIVVRH